MSKNQVLNNKTQLLEEMLIARENFRNVLDYCDFESLCMIISKFTELKHNILNEGLNFPL